MTVEPKTPTFNITESVMTNHLITFLIQYIQASQNITNTKELIDMLLLSWQGKFAQAIDVVKYSTAKTYAQNHEESEDVWNIIMDATNSHVEVQSSEFAEKLKKVIYQNLKIN